MDKDAAALDKEPVREQPSASVSHLPLLYECTTGEPRPTDPKKPYETMTKMHVKIANPKPALDKSIAKMAIQALQQQLP